MSRAYEAYIYSLEHPDEKIYRGNYKRHKEQPRRFVEVVHRPPDPWDSMTAEEKNQEQDDWLLTKGIK